MKLLETLKNKGMLNYTLFKLASNRITEKYDMQKEFSDGLRMSNHLGEISEDGLITIQVPFFTFLTVCHGDVKAVKMQDFENFVNNLTDIEIGNIKADYYSMPLELVNVLPFGYFSYIKDAKKREFTYDILIRWAQAGLDNKELIELMKLYLAARFNWKWENIERIAKYWRKNIPADVYTKLYQSHSNAAFNELASAWGIDDLPPTHPRKCMFAGLMAELTQKKLNNQLKGLNKPFSASIAELTNRV